MRVRHACRYTPDQFIEVQVLYLNVLKVGEEAVELVIEAKENNDHLFLNESADLLFHFLVLLQAKGFKLEDVINVLRERR